MSPFYTRTGDDGSTGLLGESRPLKYHPRIEALGALDEASAALGLARALCQAPQAKPILMDIQRDLYALMAEIAAAPENTERFQALEPLRIQWLESHAVEFQPSANATRHNSNPAIRRPGLCRCRQ